MNTPDASSLDYRPRLAEQVRIGPAMVVSGKTVYYVKNELTETFVRFGPRERALMSLMDGTRTVPEIARDYSAREGTAVSTPGVYQFHGLLAARGMLTFDGAKRADPPPPRSRWSMPKFAEIYFRIGDPSAALDIIEKPLRHISDKVGAFAVLLTIACCQAYVALHSSQLFDTVASIVQHPEMRVIGPFLLFMYLASVPHELAHGVMCQRYGGKVQDMGVMFRYLMLSPYCRLDDLVIMHSRKARIVTVVAGVAANLLLLAPFAVLHYVLPDSNALWKTSALMLTVYNLMIIANLLPFLRLDGYILVSTCLGRPELREEATATLKRAVGLSPAETGKPERGLLLYGVVSLLLTVAAVVAAAHFWFRTVVTFDIWSIVVAFPLTAFGATAVRQYLKGSRAVASGAAASKPSVSSKSAAAGRAL